MMGIYWLDGELLASVEAALRMALFGTIISQ
jgi:hypothetical protein